MPSSEAIDLREGKVHCLMVSDDIPVEICKTEQGSRSCCGCTAPTRRCTSCGKLNGIHDPELGRCKTCVDRLGDNASRRSARFEGTAEAAIGSVLSRVRAVATHAPSDEDTHAQLIDELEDESSSIQAVERIMQATCQHFGELKLADLIRQDRTEHPKAARHVAMHLCRTRLSLSFPIIGKMFGGRNHTTVMYANHAIETAIEDGDSVMSASVKAVVSILDSETVNVPEERLEDILARTAPKALVARRQPSEAVFQLAAAKIVQEPEKLYPLLMEHGVERNGLWTVSMPGTILMRRSHLLPDEARTVLSSLVKDGYLRGQDLWREVILLKTEGIEEIRAKLDSPRGSGTADVKLRGQTGQNIRRNKADVSEGALPKPNVPDVPVAQPIKETGGSKPVAPTPTTTSATPPPPVLRVAKSLGTYEDVYASLAERGQEIGGEKIVRGSIPVLQIRWRIGVPDVMTILEKLLVDEHIAQRDGWRAIALLKDRIIDQTPLPTKEPRQSPRSTPAQHGPRHRPSASSSGSVKPQPTAASAQSAAPSTDTLDVAIQALEAQLHLLQEHREGMNQEMQALEASLAALQRAKTRGAAISPELREALQKSALANANLLATLQE